MAYTIISQHIRKKIARRFISTPRFRDYIRDLAFLERSILHPVHGLAANMKLFGLKNQFTKDYKAMLLEFGREKEVWKMRREDENEQVDRRRIEKELGKKEKEEWVDLIK